MGGSCMWQCRQAISIVCVHKCKKNVERGVPAGTSMTIAKQNIQFNLFNIKKKLMCILAKFAGSTSKI